MLTGRRFGSMPWLDLPVADPGQLKLVAVGDQVQVTHIEAASLTVTPAAMAASPAAMRSASTWRFRANLYAWIPQADGKTSFPVDGGGDGPTLGVDLGNVYPFKFALMGNLEATNGRWGGITDVVYASFGDKLDRTRDFAIGHGIVAGSTTANLDVDLRGWTRTAAVTYCVADTPAWTMDVLAGFRLLDTRQTLGWSFEGDLGTLPPASRSGSSEVRLKNWDGIVGVKGRASPFGDRAWYVPYYADVGTGNSDLTWQASAGIGYAFGWGDVAVLYRYLGYNIKSGKPIDTLNLSG